MTVGSVQFLDFSDGRFCSFIRFQWWPILFGCRISSVLFGYEISMTVSLVLLWDFKDGQFCSIMRFKWQSAFIVSQTNFHFISYESSIRYVLCFYENSMTVGVVPIWDFSDGRICSVTRFQWVSVFKNGRFCFFARLQWQSVLFLNEISMVEGFVLLWDFNDSWFCSTSRFQWRSVLFLYYISMMVGLVTGSWSVLFEISIWYVLFFYEILMTVGFVPLCVFNGGWLCFLNRF